MHYVIGDVHGCYDDLMKLLDKIEAQDDHAEYIFTGDWVDRGPKVYDTLMWMEKNITENGKYRSVRGNHDEDARKWYYGAFKLWTENTPDYVFKTPPYTHYDFNMVVQDWFGNSKQKLDPVMEKISSLPYNIPIEITSAGGIKVKYRICHAWHTNDTSVEPERKEYINIWHRCYEGNYENDEIYVHGHTPTIIDEYQYHGEKGAERTGMIAYRHNAIDVDGGCCFFRHYPEEVCMLCAICLENLKEFYAYSLEERVEQAVSLYAKNNLPIGYIEGMEQGKYEKAMNFYREKILSKFDGLKESAARIELKQKLGLI